MLPSPAGGGSRILWTLTAAAALVLTAVPSGTRPPRFPEVRRTADCDATISHPLQLRVFPQSSLRPGELLTARIEVETRVPFDAVQVRLAAPRGVEVFAGPARSARPAASGETLTEEVTVRLAPGAGRRTVEVIVEGRIDGVVWTRSAILNLLPDGGEVAHEGVASGGRRVREVAATRVSR